MEMSVNSWQYTKQHALTQVITGARRPGVEENRPGEINVRAATERP